MNQLKVHLQETILNLYRVRGWPKRKIARELGLDRATVRKYLKAAAKPPIPHTGSAPPENSKSPALHTGSARSSCAPFRAQIEQGLQAQRSIRSTFTTTNA